MKEFTVTIDRNIKQVRTITIKAENEEQARTAAMDTANENEGWEGKEYCVECSIHIEEVPNNYIDKYGNPYDSESDSCWPAGGGLHKDCEFNADALYAYYVVKDRDNILNYLSGKGFILTTCVNGCEVWVKGNTEITFEDYDKSGHLWGYMHTELI